MLMGIIGLPRSGKTALFSALCGTRGEGQAASLARGGHKMATVTVFDERVGLLEAVFNPKKTTYAKIQYLLPSQAPGGSLSGVDDGAWSQVRGCDGFLHVVRNFRSPEGAPPESERDFRKLEEEMVLNDLAVVEKRMERIELDRKRGKKPEGEELLLLESSLTLLDGGGPLRNRPELAGNPVLRGFTFLTAKPELIIVNNDDDDEETPQWDHPPQGMERLVVRGRLEMDIAAMSPPEADEFREAYHIRESALDRLIKASYRLLNRISFFTVLSDEVRAWSVPAGTRALAAAGAVHSDMQKGFIRAETVSFEDLKAHGGFHEAKKAGSVRLEGKDYVVEDGDIIHFRFNI
jgi:hypothetical protein